MADKITAAVYNRNCLALSFTLQDPQGEQLRMNLYWLTNMREFNLYLDSIKPYHWFDLLETHIVQADDDGFPVMAVNAYDNRTDRARIGWLNHQLRQLLTSPRIIDLHLVKHKESVNRSMPIALDKLLAYTSDPGAAAKREPEWSACQGNGAVADVICAIPV